ncbi:MAG TPA: helix-hairpin-helix domain-containing protein [candidate division Zixibacteria bacterium]|nr:helix-hairpin-helix domain-containing protein [candidate division Zixibacteria bacterium]
MRLDYVSYAVAIVFFIVTLVATVSFEQQQVWVVTTVVIGLAFLGLGYTQRPKPAAPAVTTSVPPPLPSQPQRQQEQQQQEQQVPEVTTALSQPIVTDVVKLEEAKPVVQPVPSPVGGLTDVKGIGEKRAAQLRALGITSVEDLAKASAKDLAARLNISPKITDKWIQNAREIEQKP